MSVLSTFFLPKCSIIFLWISCG